MTKGTIRLMEQRIVHACGHEQVHLVYGFDEQVARKAHWLRTTQCRGCFIASKQAEQARTAAAHEVAIAHLDLPALIGSERQIGWATTIRVNMLATLTVDPVTTADADCAACLQISDAKWWIDHRSLSPGEFLAKARDSCANAHESRALPVSVQAP